MAATHAVAAPATVVRLVRRTGGPAARAAMNQPTWQRLSTGDLMTLWAQTPTTPMNIAMVGLLAPAGLLDGPGMPRLSALRSAIADRLDRASMLRRRIQPTRLGQGPPIWVDDPAFDISRHVDAAHLSGADLGQLLSWAATRAATPLPDGHPPWRLTFVTGLDTGEVGMLLVLHHAIADGVTGAALATALLDSDPGERSGRTAWAPAPGPTGPTLAREAAATRLRALARLVSGPRHTTGLRRDLHATRAALARRAPDLRLPVPQNTERQAVALSWPLAEVREAAHRHQVTINELMLAAVAAGMRSLLADRGLRVADLGLRVSVPVAAPPGTRNAGGTLPMVLSLPVDDPDPESALRRVHAVSREAKAGRDRAYPGPAHSALVPRCLVHLAIRWLRGHSASRINLYLTNVPGPAHPLWLCGARLHTAYPIAPIAAGVPIAAAALSYHDTLCLTINTAPDLDLHPFLDGARQALARLTAAVTQVPTAAGTAATLTSGGTGTGGPS
jgi:diacylglycerol O-acyltransferase / wax synthase